MPKKLLRSSGSKNTALKTGTDVLNDRPGQCLAAHGRSMNEAMWERSKGIFV